jgi:hypothetical protein
MLTMLAGLQPGLSRSDLAFHAHGLNGPKPGAEF